MLEFKPTELEELEGGGGAGFSIRDEVELDKEGGRCSCAESVEDDDEGGGGPYEFDDVVCAG